MPIIRVASTTVLVLLSIGSAGAVNPPEMKEGLWMVHSQTIKDPGRKKIDATSTLCRSHAYDHYVRALARRVNHGTNKCTTLKDSLHGKTYSVVMRCDLGSVVINSSSITTYQSDSTHTETHQRYVPPLNGVSEATVIEDQKFLGPCPIGSKPGDLTQANGTELQMSPPHP